MKPGTLCTYSCICLRQGTIHPKTCMLIVQVWINDAIIHPLARTFTAFLPFRLLCDSALRRDSGIDGSAWPFMLLKKFPYQDGYGSAGPETIESRIENGIEGVSAKAAYACLAYCRTALRDRPLNWTLDIEGHLQEGTAVLKD